MNSNILDEELSGFTKKKIRTESLKMVEKIATYLIVITLLIDIGVCYASSDYFLFSLLALIFGGGTLYSIFEWKKEIILFDQSHLKQVFHVKRKTRITRQAIVAFIVLKLLVMLFFVRIFYYSLSAGFSIVLFPLWQLTLPLISLIIAIVLMYYFYITRQIEKKSQKHGK